jgi:hypothetical protein
MVQRVIAVVVVSIGVAFAIVAFIARDTYVVQPSSDLTRPCLLNAQGCRELSAEPFAPCLASSDRCSQEHRLEALRETHTQSVNGAPRRMR